jgi:hypothetical protein
VQGADGENAEGGHGAGPGSGADGGVVFAVEGVTPVKRLNRPLDAYEADDGLGTGAVCGQAGDAERGNVRQRAAVQGGGMPLDQARLADVRKRQIRGARS